MLKMLHASTLEVDYPEEAVQDILGQISESELCAHSIGILSCSYDYILNGTMKALSEALPFEVIGCTTYLSDISTHSDEYQLSLAILTSDTVLFATGISEPLYDGDTQSLARLYTETIQKLGREAAFAICFAPSLAGVSVDVQTEILSQASEGLPLFGAVALDPDTDISNARTLYQGNASSNQLVLLLLTGDIQPHFFVRSVPPENFLHQSAMVTSSDNNIIKGINNLTATEYLEMVGIDCSDMIEHIPLFSFSIDFGDKGAAVTRTIFNATEEGYLICGGNVPEGSSLRIGSLSPESVCKTASQLAQDIIDSSATSGALIFSCMGRSRILGIDTFKEINQIQDSIGKKLPYLFMYSAGEIYPELFEGKVLNKVLNDSIIACVF